MKLIFAFLAILALSFPASAHSYKFGDVVIGHVWAKPTKAETAKVFMPLLNEGAADDMLTSASSPVADSVGFYKTLNTGEASPIARMILVHDQPIPMNENGIYLLLTGLKKPLAAGDRVPLTLVFTKAGSVNVDVVVEEKVGH